MLLIGALVWEYLWWLQTPMLYLVQSCLSSSAVSLWVGSLQVSESEWWVLPQSTSRFVDRNEMRATSDCQFCASCSQIRTVKRMRGKRNHAISMLCCRRGFLLTVAKMFSKTNSLPGDFRKSSEKGSRCCFEWSFSDLTVKNIWLVEDWNAISNPVCLFWDSKISNMSRFSAIEKV